MEKIIDLDSKALRAAIDKYSQEQTRNMLREFIVYGPPELNKIYEFYLKELKQKEERRQEWIRFFMPIITVAVLLISMYTILKIAGGA